MEQKLDELKVKSKVYFGQDCYVSNSIHKIYSDFLEGNTTLIDGFKTDDPELYEKLHELRMILREQVKKIKNIEYLAKMGKRGQLD